MMADNRSTSAPWLLPPIALQILHYLDDADDAHAFLQAAPNDSLDDALDALRTLLAMDVELPLWPTAHIAGLDEAYTSVFATALPLFKTITVTSSQNNCKICHATELPPTTALSATVEDGVISVRAALGDWLPRLVDLKVMSGNDLNAVALVKDDLSACHDLRALTMNQEDGLGQDAFDAALTAVIATCPQVERICVGSSSLSYMSDCKHLVAWLALPSARHLKVECTDFQDELGAELAVAMLTSTTLETIELSEVPNLTRAILCPSSPPMPSQLQHLTICDCMTTGGYDSWDDGNNTTVDPPSAFDESNVVDVATKISTASSLKSLDLWSRTSCDATPVVNILPQLPTLTKLALQDVHLAAFPSLRQLWHLELWWVSFSDDAIASLATLLCSSPKLTG
ncbi:hypothetical protein SDRG_02219 [Saprolegnia diclina VS20]|uniref:F-box domain-containing protein n=1 Tax=Saprolegnia diclina (strain VS20) TaxID=1156394 RepID=T0SC06_SAPDV|nr:hypothetical protein SDRG_02219 [Saprolegnia diclina VS20]EQC40317.1 hypothetical protein SDRG_02219 [Saprolegnia diclina VS20]|eukprot:XP_008606016.1 hypothetical protein SDRG_02219 [Saprolegnia diclina VS20]